MVKINNRRVAVVACSWQLQFKPEQMARVEAVNDEITKLQHKTFAQVQSATAEAIKLWTGSFEYATQLSNEYRKLALEATRQGLALATSTPRV